MKRIIGCLFSLLLMANIAHAEKFVAGTDYTVLDANAPKQKQVSVIEFFNYGCPWCSLVDPTVEKWRDSKPRYVDFSRIPVTFEQGWGAYAKAYYFAESLGIERKITPALFLAIHGANDQQMNDLSSSDAMIKFFVQQGVKKSDAEAVFNKTDPSIEAQVQAGNMMMKIYKVYAIPCFVVGDKYSVQLGQAKTPERFIAILNYLVELSHQK